MLGRYAIKKEAWSRFPPKVRYRQTPKAKQDTPRRIGTAYDLSFALFNWKLAISTLKQDTIPK